MTTTQLYHNLTISETTQKKRRQIKTLQDRFCTFSWGGFDAFENFGAFIINDKKGSLKFYNGPGFSNEYTKPQFDVSGGKLTGVTFNKQSISFTIGVYWISIEHYRLLLNWLSPLTTSYLIFGFNEKFRYNVKLSKLGDSTRYIVGNEMIVVGTKTVEILNEETGETTTETVEITKAEPRYYTELSLTFEIQGDACAKGVNSYEFEPWALIPPENTNEKIFRTYLKTNLADFVATDLSTPFEVSLPFNIFQDDSITDQTYSLLLKLGRQNKENSDSTEVLELFNINLCKLTHGNSLNTSSKLNLTYNSQNGLVYISQADSKEEILSLSTLNDTGDRIVKAYSTYSAKLPGEFDYPGFFSDNDIYLEFYIKKMGTDKDVTHLTPEIRIPSGFFSTDPALIVCYPRTNTI